MTDEALEALPSQLAEHCRDQACAATGDDATHTAQLIEQVVYELGEFRDAEYAIADARRAQDRRRKARLLKGAG